MAGDDEIRPDEALGLLDEYLEYRNCVLKPRPAGGDS
jgi:hypothetical protein